MCNSFIKLERRVILTLISDFFRANNVVINFVYPLIFFLMGFSILLKNTRYSRFDLAKSLQYLALFGLIHGISDWGNVFIPIQKSYLDNDDIFVLESIKLIINSVSFFFLFYFGIHLLQNTKKWNRKILLIPLFIIVVWIANFLVLQPYLVNESNQKWWFAISDIWARYLLAFPGAIISSYSLFIQKDQFKELGFFSMTKTLKFAVVSIGLYAITGGIIVPYAPVLPAILFNSEIFTHSTGLPVELFRGLSGVFMAIFILKILKVFDMEYQYFIQNANKERAILEERNMIARDLHDGMIQSIYAIGLHLERVRNLLSNKSKLSIEQAEVEVEGVVKKLNDIIREIRGYIKELKIPCTDKGNMREEIEKLIEEININKQLQIDFQYRFIGEDPPLSKTVQIKYIIKESLSNIIRHAQASEAIINISGNKNDLLIDVIDNGIGIEENNEYTNQDEAVLFKQGIKNMRYRAQAIGGKFCIESTKLNGTKISLHL